MKKTTDQIQETDMNDIRAMQEENTGKGQLQINVTSAADSKPVAEARIAITYTGVPESALESVNGCFRSDGCAGAGCSAGGVEP